MNLNITYGSTSGAPAAFFSAVNYVVGLLDATFTNNVTVNPSGQINGLTAVDQTLMSAIVWATRTYFAGLLLNRGPTLLSAPSWRPRRRRL